MSTHLVPPPDAFPSDATADNDCPPPTSLSPLDRALLHEGHLQLQVDDLRLAAIKRDHEETLAAREKHVAAFNEFIANLRARYLLTETTPVNPETGAIVRA